MEDGTIDFSNKATTFKEILMNHLSRITRLYSCELRGGYYTVLNTKEGGEKETYVEDTREALENAIYCLAHLLIKKIEKDKRTNEKFNTFHEELNKIKKEFMEKTEVKENEILGESYYNDEEKVLLEEYKIRKLNLYKDLFSELSRLLDKENFLNTRELTFGGHGEIVE